MGLSHINSKGEAQMVDVGHKSPSQRTAVASGHIRMTAEAMAAIAEGRVAKGDVLATARIAGIMAAKRTAELIPLCHPLPLSSVEVAIEAEGTAMIVTATARTTAQTGVEMEAMMAASVALLTLYDMVKAMDKAMVIEEVRLLSKTGGKSGDWIAPTR